MKTGACSEKNGCSKPAKLLMMDLVSIKMLRNETCKLEITSYHKKGAKKKKEKTDKAIK